MKVLSCAQGSAEWHRARLGRPTASHFHEIITPKTRKPSTSANAYMMRLLAEWIIGVPSDAASSGFMERGIHLEEPAARQYAYMRDVDPVKIGLVLRDDEMVAGSPDRLIGDDGLLEVKTPSATIHVQHLLEGFDGHFCQVQGCLWLTGRRWADLMSYSPEMPPVIVRMERDNGFIEALVAEVDSFVHRLLEARARLLDLGCKPAERLMLPASMVVEDAF